MMKKIDILGISFGNFKRRKMRSILTVLGVVIGTASIVVMMSLGIAINKSFDESFASMGDLTKVNVYTGWDENTNRETGELNDELIEKLKGIENVDAVSPEIQLQGKMISGRYEYTGQIMGVDLSLMDKMGLEVEKGSPITGEEVTTSRSFYMLAGSEVPFRFRKKTSGRGGGMYMSMGGMSMSMGGGGNAVEEERIPDVDIMAENTKIRYTFDYSYGNNTGGNTSTKKKAQLYTVHTAGILKKSNGQSDYSIYIDLETAKAIKKEADKFFETKSNSRDSFKYDSISVYANSMEATEEIVNQIQDMGYNAWSNGEYISMAKGQLGMVQALLGAIGSVSLIVAAIGITNTMIMSIYERTREIGIMKVIGCYLKDIRTMFLIEASFIGFFGGIVGIGISYALSFAMNKLAAGGAMGGSMGMGGMSTTISVIPPWLALLAIVFATLVALVSGFLPARRAMRLSALEAMKN